MICDQKIISEALDILHVVIEENPKGKELQEDIQQALILLHHAQWMQEKDLG